MNRPIFMVLCSLTTAAVAAQPDTDTLYSTRVRPIFAERCTGCHGESKHKGGLALHTPAAILKGSDDGPVIIAGKPDKSEIVRRLRLPASDTDHMPPSNKPQLTEEQIRTIEAWIAAGAKFSATGAPASPATQPAALPAKPRSKAPPPDPAAIEALRSHLVHVEAIAAGSNELWLDFAAAAKRITEEQAIALLKPLLQQIETLSLARCKVGDKTATVLAEAPRLHRLDLHGAGITDAGLRALAHHAALADLVLAQTHLTDAAIESLTAMPQLKRVFLWHSGLSPDAITRLRQKRPDLHIEAGDASAASIEETEPAFKLTNGAPPPPASQPAATTKPAGKSDRTTGLKPVNDKCPVSGQAVDPKYTIVYKNRVIGFCCPKCPGAFWADPAKFESKLPAPKPAG